MESMKFSISRVGKVIIKLFIDGIEDSLSFVVCKIDAQNSSVSLFALMDRYNFDDCKSYFGFIGYTGYKVFACLEDLKSYINCQYGNLEPLYVDIIYDGDLK